MRQTSVARWAVIANAARRMQRAITGAAVKTASSEQRDKSSFGHRKPARSDNPKVGGSNPPPATIKASENGCLFSFMRNGSYETDERGSLAYFIMNIGNKKSIQNGCFFDCVLFDITCRSWRWNQPRPYLRLPYRKRHIRRLSGAHLHA